MVAPSSAATCLFSKYISMLNCGYARKSTVGPASVEEEEVEGEEEEEEEEDDEVDAEPWAVSELPSRRFPRMRLHSRHATGST